MRSNSPQIRLKTTLQLVCLIWLLICAVITARDLDWTIDRGTRRGTAPFMTEQRRKELKAMAKRMFYHGFDNYMEHAFPMDELDPIKCQGRGPDYATPSNIAINDVLGNYSVTLVDVLDTLVVLGDRTGFEKAVRDVLHYVSFDTNAKVQVFESTIRVLGGLLSGHMFASTPQYGFAIDGYNNELLMLAKDLADRLMPAFTLSATGIPHPRINLKFGLPKFETFESCTAGGGSLILEFGTLSRLLNDTQYEAAAKKAFYALWNRRSDINLVGNGINVMTGQWTQPASSIGAGVDSFFEYCIKAYVLFGEPEYLDVFNEAYAAVLKYVRDDTGYLYRNVHMTNGNLMSYWVDSLSAFWPGMQVLAGDLDNAIKSHLFFWNIWNKYGALPERFNFQQRNAELLPYPLRPEFIESTYYLYQATKDSFFLHVGERILMDFENFTRVDCGYAGVENVITGELGGRMESFALSETLKYAYLLFDEDNPFNHRDSNFIFTTEGHILELNHTYLKTPPKIRRKLRGTDEAVCPNSWSRDPFAPSVVHRRDADYPKALVGVQGDFVPHVDQDGYCEVPIMESSVMEVLFGPNEDTNPPSSKVLKLMNGIIVSDIEGIKMEITRRADHLGYDITKIGPHRVLSSQSVVLRDSKVSAAWTSGDNGRYDNVIVRGAWESSPGWTEHYNWYAAPAEFGPPIESQDSSLRHLVHYKKDAYGCLDVPSDIRPEINGKVLFVLRGECTFQAKMDAAFNAGAAALLVSSTDNFLIKPAGGEVPATQDDTDGMCAATMTMGVPLVLVTNETGTALGNALLKAGAGQRIPDVVTINDKGQKAFIKSPTVEDNAVLGTGGQVRVSLHRDGTRRDIVDWVMDTEAGPKLRKMLTLNSLRIMNAFIGDV